MAKTELTHIVGTRVFYRLKLAIGATPQDLSTMSAIVFQGTSDSNRAVSVDLRTAIDVDGLAVKVMLSTLVNESSDKFVRGRFFLTFPGGDVKPSQQLQITVRR